MDATWRYKFKKARKKLGLTRREVAVRSGVSLESVRAYEGGQRNPTKARLIQLLHAIEATTYDANEILEAAGYSTPASMFPEEEYPDYFFSIEQLQSEVELVQWPSEGKN